MRIRIIASCFVLDQAQQKKGVALVCSSFKRSLDPGICTASSSCLDVDSLVVHPKLDCNREGCHLGHPSEEGWSISQFASMAMNPSYLLLPFDVLERVTLLGGLQDSKAFVYAPFL
jgi:hypothetical protein